jgi:hypothetical protein
MVCPSPETLRESEIESKTRSDGETRQETPGETAPESQVRSRGLVDSRPLQEGFKNCEKRRVAVRVRKRIAPP